MSRIMASLRENNGSNRSTTILFPFQLIIGSDEKTIIAISNRVSSVADSIGLPNKLRSMTSAKVIVMSMKRALAASHVGRTAI